MCAAAAATTSLGLTAPVSTVHWVACCKVVGYVRCSADRALVAWAATAEALQLEGLLPCYHTVRRHSSIGGFADGLIALWLWVYRTWHVKSFRLEFV